MAIMLGSYLINDASSSGRGKSVRFEVIPGDEKRKKIKDQLKCTERHL